MNKIKRFLAVSLTVVVMSSVLAISALAADSFGSAAAAGDNAYTLKDMLKYSLEDEYLAYAEYSKIIDTYGNVKPFSNIIKAEQRHITALETLFGDLGIAKPDNTAAAYVTTPSSITEALNAGILAEKNNIAMYEKFLDQNLPDDVKLVFTALKNASEHHLNAFERSLSGETAGQSRNGNTGMSERGRGHMGLGQCGLS